MRRVLLMMAALAACHPPAPAQLKNVDCKAVKMPAEPDLFALDARTRAELDRLRRQGVVAVRYEGDGCNMSLEVLPKCVGPKDRYVYSALKGAVSKVTHDPNELFQHMPVGASSLVGHFENGHVLRTNAKQVGTVDLTSAITEYDLVGPECKQATHIVRSFAVGGFSIIAGTPAVVNDADAFVNPPVDPIVREGFAAACERAMSDGKEVGGCTVPIRLKLAPLNVPPEVAKNAPPPPSSTTATPSRPPPDTFDQSAIERVVRDRVPAIKRKCWDTSSERLRRVTLSIAITVDPKGNVIGAAPQVTDADGPPDLAANVSRCFAAELQTWQFPEPDSQKVLTLPFHLIRQ